ncbi:hypothetical protein BD626DRAFT_460050 [Schizophyllum amplum]|uniref:Uncharacterized protein n=1 Tax=Schizophyllum amplum TaxID=97359 RepID=A0A550C923_9AGAR|nr:hypothetical protein BD626DRAFT_460050 [Auriculariopsis ampla]
MTPHADILTCLISGATENLRQCRLISESAEEEEFQIACKEWIFGIPRGSLAYYTHTQENIMIFREDICRMYTRGEFVLAPTFKTYIDTMEFVQRAGITDRKDNDESPRRPLTALISPARRYRYVFIPFTDAARALQQEFKMQPQTDEDLNGGWLPRPRRLLREGSDAYPVVESHAHPFSVATLAETVFRLRPSTEITAQWLVCSDRIVDLWRCEKYPPPQWFVDAPKFGEDDTDLSTTEASGYDPLLSESKCEPELVRPKRETDAAARTTDPRTKVTNWCGKVDLKAKPVEEELHRSPVKLRRSTRIAARAGPYASSSPERCASPPPEEWVPPSPPRRAPWPSARGRDPIRYPPAWEKRNGRFPTSNFSSNDWAYFQYGVALAARTSG